MQVPHSEAARETSLTELAQSVSPFGEVASPKDGGELLSDAVATDTTVAASVKRMGVPDAIEVHAAGFDRWFDVFYRSPPRTLVFGQSTMYVNVPRQSMILTQMDEVPRSVRRLAFREGPLPPPWPVTISPAMRDAFGVPALGSPAPRNISGGAWNALAKSLSSEMPAPGAAAVERLRRLSGPLGLPNMDSGLVWQAVAFESGIPAGFGAPNGTLFVSTALMALLKDAELTAVLAHLMGHERYQHYPFNLEGAQRMHFAASTIPLAAEVPKYPEILTQEPYAYSRWQEIEANRAAVGYLSKLGIPPDILFDALTKLATHSAELGTGEWPNFAEIHKLPRNAADLGRLLDAGLIGSPADMRASGVTLPSTPAAGRR